jgi:hypothetical protein
MYFEVSRPVPVLNSMTDVRGIFASLLICAGCHQHHYEEWASRLSTRASKICSSIYIFLILSLASCASVQTQQEWKKVKAFSMERTGVETRWQQTEEDIRVAKESADKLLSDGLTEEDAVSIALLNNRKLQASFEEIGLAKADLVQAGLFTNPNLSAEPGTNSQS